MTTEFAAETDTVISIEAPEDLFALMQAKFAEHDIAFQPEGASQVVQLDEFGMRIEVELLEASLAVRLAAREAGHLFFMKEELIEIVEKIDPKMARDIRWSDADAQLDRPPNFDVFHVLAVTDVMDGLRRISLRAEHAERFTTGGMHFRAIVPKTAGRPPVWPSVGSNGVTLWPEGKDELHARTLTVRQVRVEEGQLDVDIALHAGGLISDWALAAVAGTEIGVMGPGGETGLPVHTGLMIAGDKTALPSIARLLELLPAEAEGDVIICAESLATATAYLPPTGLDLQFIPEAHFRGGIQTAVKEIAGRKPIKHLWFGGEFDDAQALRKFGKSQLGLGKGQNSCVAYWREGHAGER
ncbi:MAG: siderophore-interacting protein [Pseudomonadota bacterium]